MLRHKRHSPEARYALTAAACQSGWAATLEKPPPEAISAPVAGEATTCAERPANEELRS